ncbi:MULTISPECIES: SCP2 sterol-binding domain-containing protein [Sorangium]|uniref:SCP2 sterol-binding domain-containing protein n=1 Tax=Sorangium TaxID=39643 RepID=UPI00101A56BB|nr:MULTISPECIES: SCP2 sterol-binding domain-containing protein [Sorangium]
MSKARKLIEALAAGRYDARLRGIRRVCAVQLSDDERILVEIADGSFGVAPEGASEDCQLSCSLDDFLRIVRGEQSLITAIMQGRVGVRGDLGVAQMFQSVFSPRDDQTPEATR